MMNFLVRHKLFFLLMFLSSAGGFYAQDIHFTNWNMSPLNVNVANAGRFDGDGRLIFNYRKQWQSVPVPYGTFSFGSDFNLKQSLIKGTNEAIGIVFNHDQAGDGRYKINEVKIPINHKIKLKDSTFTFAIGVAAGITNISIDPNRLSFDKQWDGDIYNSGLYNGEAFDRLSKTYFDAGLGSVISKNFNPKLSITLGYSLNHFHKPNISFNNTANVLLRPRHLELFQTKYNFSNKASVLFEYYGAQQQKFREHVLALSYYYMVNSKTKTILNLGLITRIKDAVMPTCGLEYNNIKMQLSYDYNYSSFKRATSGRGGFEISLIYIYAKPKVFVPKTRICPIYM